MPTWSLFEPVVEAGDQPAEAEPGSHREPDPEGQVAVEGRELAQHCRRLLRRRLRRGPGGGFSRSHLCHFDGSVEEVAEQVVELGESVAAGAVAGAQSLDLADDQAGVLEDFEVLGDGRLREGELVDELAAVAGVVGEQQPQDPDACGVPERFREQCDVVLEGGRVFCCDRHETRAVWWRAAALIPAGRPRSGFVRGISCGQA